MTVASARRAYGIHETHRTTVFMVRLFKGERVKWLYRWSRGSKWEFVLHEQWDGDTPIPNSVCEYEHERAAKASQRCTIVKQHVKAGWCGEVVQITRVSTQEITPVHSFPTETDAVALLGQVGATP